MALSSARQSKTMGVIQAKEVDIGLFSVADAYGGSYDFFASSVLFPQEKDAEEKSAVNVIADGGPKYIVDLGDEAKALEKVDWGTEHFGFSGGGSKEPEK